MHEDRLFFAGVDTGALYSVSMSSGSSIKQEISEGANIKGMAWSVFGSKMYTVDNKIRALRQYDVDVDSGAIGECVFWLNLDLF